MRAGDGHWLAYSPEAYAAMPANSGPASGSQAVRTAAASAEISEDTTRATLSSQAGTLKRTCEEATVRDAEQCHAPASTEKS